MRKLMSCFKPDAMHPVTTATIKGLRAFVFRPVAGYRCHPLCAWSSTRFKLILFFGIGFLVLTGAFCVNAADRPSHNQKSVESVFLGRSVVMPDFGIGGTGGIGPGGADNWSNYL